MRALVVCALAGLALGACAPGPSIDPGPAPLSRPDAGTSPIVIDVSGTALVHPLSRVVADRTGRPLDFSNLAVAVADPVALMADSAAAPLAVGALDTRPGACAAAGCTWTHRDVDIAGATLGLAAVVEDLRTTPLWLDAVTTIAGVTAVAGLKEHPQPLAGARAFAVSVDTEAALVALVNALEGGARSPGELAATGFLLGTVVGKASDGHAPVAGATVDGGAGARIYYPTEALDGAGAATSTTGLFLALPATDGLVAPAWTATGPGGDARTWAPVLAGLVPGKVSVLQLAAEP